MVDAHAPPPAQPWPARPWPFSGLFVAHHPAAGFYPALQGLRGLSACSVFLVHIYRMAMNGSFLPPLPDLLHAGWSTLGTGVGLFFMISGFVIPGSLVRHDNLRKFFVDRLLRIMPLFVVIHTAVFTVGLAVGYKWLAHVTPGRYAELFVSNLTFTALPLGLPLLQQNSWSLTYEWLFYLTLAGSWHFRYAIARQLALKAALAVVAIAACWFWPMCLYFAAGVALTRLRFAPGAFDAAEGIVALACLALYLGLAQFSSTAFALVPASLLFLMCLREGGVTNRMFRHPVLMWLGTVSFSLYLLHPLLMFPLQSLLARLAHHGASKTVLLAFFAAASTAIVMPASWLSYRLIEVRLRAALHKALDPWVSSRDHAQDHRHAAAAAGSR